MQTHIAEDIFNLIDQYSPRNWRSEVNQLLFKDEERKLSRSRLENVRYFKTKNWYVLTKILKVAQAHKDLVIASEKEAKDLISS